MKRSILVAALLIMSTPAAAESFSELQQINKNPWTTGLDVGVSIFKDVDLTDTAVVDLKKFVSVRGNFGRNFGKHLRGELDVGWRRHRIDEIEFPDFDVSFEGAGKVNVVTSFANLYAETDFRSIRPFIGGGAGIAYFKAKSDPGALLATDDGNISLAWNGTVGFSWFPAYTGEFQIFYRYTDYIEPELVVSVPLLSISDTLELDTASHEVMFGWKYRY